MSKDLDIHNGLTWREIAKAAYHVYCVSTGVMGLPSFEDLPGNEKAGWESAVRFVGSILDSFEYAANDIGLFSDDD